MKLRCPACGSDINLDQAVRDRDQEELVRAAARFGTDWQLISEYLDGFRLRKDGALALKKRLRLLKEVWVMWESGRFQMGGQWWLIGREEFKAALADVNNRELLGLKNHNYLKQVLKAAAKQTSVRMERERRGQEHQKQAGFRTDQAQAVYSPETRKMVALVKASFDPKLTVEERARIKDEIEQLKQAQTGAGGKK